MRKLLLYFLFVLILCFCYFALPAQQRKIDSLKALISKDKADTNKINHLNRASDEYKKVGNYDSSLHYSHAAMQLAQTLKFNNGIANAYNCIGNVYNNQGNYPEALKNYFASLKIKEKIRDKHGIAALYNNIGIVYDKQGNYPEALKNYFASLKIREEINDKHGIAGSYNNIGFVYYYQGNYIEALKNYLSSLRIFETIGDKHGIATSYGNIGEVNFKQGNYPEALKNQFISLRIREALGDKEGIAISYSNIGEINIKLKKLNDAESYLNKGLQLSIEIGSKDDIKSCYEWLAAADSARGNFRQAYQHYKLYSVYKDSIDNEETKKKSLQASMQYEFDKKEIAARAEQDKKDTIQLAESRKQKFILFLTFGFLILVLVFFAFVYRQRNRIAKEKKRSDELLLNILPSETAEELKLTGQAEPKQFDMVTVMFTDFKGFTQIAEKMSAKELVGELDFLFKKFDEIISIYPIEKIKTIGDAYMCAGGLPVSNISNAMDVTLAALDIQKFMAEHNLQQKENNKPIFQIRIGIHTGPIVAGIVGIKKFAYDIWGDTVNTASRMESSGEAGIVNISETTYKYLSEMNNQSLRFTFRGKIQAKNKEDIEMYFVEKTHT